MTVAHAPVQRTPMVVFGGAILVGALVSVALGVYGRVHDPASETTWNWIFTSTLHFKSWMATIVLFLAVLQLLGALWMYGKLGRAAPPWVGPTHRIIGSLTLLATLPVAYHCLWSLGFDPAPGGGRRFWHSLFGCLVYGAFATKIIVVRVRGMPRWALPVVGGVLFTLLVLVWLTSSLWFFTQRGLEF